MYNYEWDKETGGYLLTAKPTSVIKEVRPVYWEELCLLGFDKQFGWKFPKCEEPLLWAEARRYFYKGELVGEANGGGLFTLPKIVSHVNNLVIEPVDVMAMVEKNKSLMVGFVAKTLEFIYGIYKRYANKKVDIVYVAFSGGKDSIVLLDLVQRALPHDGFKVLFADTTMELPETLKAVEESQKHWDTLEWHIAKSHMNAIETWEKIGPPAEKMRWCCNVHKTVPQVLKIKELAKKNNFKTLVFLGMRKEESAARAEYESLADSKKHFMQTSCCPILEWNTSELFLYLLEHKLLFNTAYRKGLTRAGCIFCPMASNWTFAINSLICSELTAKYSEIIDKAYAKDFKSLKDRDKFYYDRGWQTRLNGRDIKEGIGRLTEFINKEVVDIVLTNPSMYWYDWVKVVGEIVCVGFEKYELYYKDICFPFKVKEEQNFIRFQYEMPERNKTNLELTHLFKNALYKVAYCIQCKICIVDCKFAVLEMNEEKIISNGCVHCGSCLKQTKGCVVAKSLSVSGGITKMAKKSIGGYETRGFRNDWLKLYFELQGEFWTNTLMGPNMFKSFQKWFFESELGNKKEPSELCNSLIHIEPDKPLLWSVLFNNLAYNSPLFNWFVKNISFNHPYDNEYLKMLMGEDYKKSVKDSALSSLKETLKASPIGDVLGQGICKIKGNSVVSITRTVWEMPEPLAILYCLYKFAEKMDNYYNFTVDDLLDDSLERIGLSPAILFGINKKTLKPILQGLSHDYVEFIKVSFNKDLENINLTRGKTSLDIAKLF